MKIQHYNVILIDLPEVLPFTVRPDLKRIGLKKSFEKIDLAEKKLLEFVEILEKNYKKEFYFIGEDIIEEKLFKRFIFSGGLLEIMVQAPSAISAHFINLESAKKFVLALKRTLDKVVKDEKIREMLKSGIEFTSKKEETLTYDVWVRMKKIREI